MDNLQNNKSHFFRVLIKINRLLMVVVPLFSSLLYTAKWKKLPLNPVSKADTFLDVYFCNSVLHVVDCFMTVITMLSVELFRYSARYHTAGFWDNDREISVG